MQIFISADETGVIEYGCLYLSTLFFFFFLQALMFSLSSFFRGVGDMNVSLAMVDDRPVCAHRFGLCPG